MKSYVVVVNVVTKGRKVKRGQSCCVEASDLEAAKEVARLELQERGYKPRSFHVGTEGYILAYVNE